MATHIVSLSPSAFVQRICVQGLPVADRALRLTAYVSGRHRSPLAAAVLAQLDQAIDGTATAAGHGAAVAELRTLRSQVRATGGAARESNWRRVFTGQGRTEHLQAVAAYIVGHRAFLESLPALRAADPSQADHPTRSYTWSAWFATGDVLRALVADGVFGYDCLGFIGNHLCDAGIETSYPERSVAQYAALPGAEALTSLERVSALTLLVWPGSAGHTQHIAIVDRVHRYETNARGRPTLRVDICQSSAGGPQCNQGVQLIQGGGMVATGHGSLTGFRMSSDGTPPAPVRGTFGLVRHPDWLLARSGS